MPRLPRSALLLAALLPFAGCRPGPRSLAAPGEALRPCPSTPNCVSTGAADADARVVRFRTASRVGRSDLGVNRARMRRFPERFRASADGAARR